MGHWDVVWNGYDTVFTVISVLAIFLLSINYMPQKKTLLTRLVDVIGANTLGIYFVHMYFVYLTKEWIRSIDMCRNMVVDIAYSVSILLLSLVVVLVIKRVPAMRRLV